MHCLSKLTSLVFTSIGADPHCVTVSGHDQFLRLLCPTYSGHYQIVWRGGEGRGGAHYQFILQMGAHAYIQSLHQLLHRSSSAANQMKYINVLI